jgi:AraC-like DNA-binding protein
VRQAGYLHERYHYFHLKDSMGQERDFHFHEFDKIVILLSGRVEYLVEDEVYALKPWDVLLVKHHTIHKAEIDKTLPYERIIIYFDRKYFEHVLPDAKLMDCFDIADRHGRHLLKAEPEQLEELKACIERYEALRGDERFGASAMGETMMIQLLIHISRLTEVEPGEADNKYDPKIQQVLSYINENFREELSVDELADSVFLSKYYFMRLFKAQTGTTVYAYVRQKRLMNASRLIREGVPAAKAASDSGFGDYSAFHRAFKASFGSSP